MAPPRGNSNGKKHGLTIGGRTPTYVSWQHMKDRCYNERSQFYPDYGGRGITVCETWRASFAAFLADMGPRPDGKTLDRIDVHGNYEPGNCRWADLSTQALNRRNRRMNANKRAKKTATARRRVSDASE